MPTAPHLEQQGAQGIYLEELVQLVASSSHFQRRLGTKGNTARLAENFVHYPWVIGDVDNDKFRTTSRPFAVVEDAAENWSDEGDGVLMPNGTFSLTLSDTAQYVEDQKQSYKDFRAFIDGVLQDIVDGVRINGRLFPVITIEQTQTPALSSPLMAENVPYWLAKFDIEWSSTS